MQKLIIVAAVAGIALGAVACKKESMCSEESIAALPKLRSIVSGMGVDRDALGEDDDKIFDLQKDLMFDGTLRTSVERLREDIAAVRGQHDSPDDMVSAEEDLARTKAEVLRDIESAEQYCEPS